MPSIMDSLQQSHEMRVKSLSPVSREEPEPRDGHTVCPRPRGLVATALTLPVDDGCGIKHCLLVTVRPKIPMCPPAFPAPLQVLC